MAQLQMYIPCIEDGDGSILLRCGPMLNWNECMHYLERNLPMKLNAGQAVPQPSYHPGIHA